MPNALLKKIAGNSAILIAEKLLGMGVNLGIVVVITRTLGAERWGELAHGLALMAMALPFCALGLAGLISREIINKPSQQASIIATATVLRMLGAAVGLTTLYLLCRFWLMPESQLTQGYTLLLIGAGFTSLLGLNFYFEAKMQAKIPALIRLGCVLVCAPIKLYVAFKLESVQWLMATYGLELALQGLLFLICYQFYSRELSNWRFDFSIAKSLLSRCGWLILSSAAIALYQKIDQVMLAQMTTLNEVGQYALAARLSEIWYFIPIAIVASLFPPLLKLKNANDAQYPTRLQQACDLLLVLALLLAIGVQLVGEPVITWVFGDQYRYSVAILQLHIWSGLFVFMRALASRWLMMEDLLKFSLVTHLAGAVINIAANLILIPDYAGLGAAWATLISYACAGWLAFYFGRSTRPMASVMTRSLCLPFRAWKPLIALVRRP